MPKSDIPVDVLTEQLHGSDWTARCDAARLLGQSGDARAVDALLPDLQDADWRVRRNAAQALGALRDTRTVGALITLLNDRTLTVRQRAIVALGRIKDLQALPVLIDIVLQGKRESHDAVKAIRKFGKKGLPEIAKAYETSQNQELLLLLVDLKYPRVFEMLVKSLENNHALTTRPVIIRQLGKLGDRRAISHLRKELDQTDPLMQADVVNALGQLGATESTPALLGLLKDDELYGPHSGTYRAVTNAFQLFGGVTGEIENAFPGNYPAMFNLGGAPISLPEAMGLMGKSQLNILNDALSRFQTDFKLPENMTGQLAESAYKAVEDMTWKFGVMFQDAKDAKQERVTRLVELLRSQNSLTRAAAALTLPWYGEERSLEPLKQLLHDPDETVRIVATWSVTSLQKALSYRNHLGM
jgi:HEAT repeat protein